MTTPRTPELEDVLRLALENFQSGLHVALPGRIESYDASSQTASVKPLLKNTFIDDEGVDVVETLPVINRVPIQFARGGGFFLSFPIVKGDHVLLVFNERSIDKFQTGDGDDTDPVDIRMHNLSDPVALPGFYPDSKALADAHVNNTVLGKDGGTQIHVADGKIELGAEGSSDKASLDSKLQTELTRLKAELNALKAIFDAHIHITTATVGAGPTPGVISPTLTPFPAAGSPSATASALVTIDG